MEGSKMAGLTLHKKPANGTVKKWLDEVAAPFTGPDCLPFPFSLMKSGHGHISARLGANYAHTYIAKRVLGECPAGHEVCHDCGNPSCVNPKHLYWGTRSENMDDRWRHGGMTLPPVKRGASNGNSVMTEEQARSAKAQLKLGVKPCDIAKQSGVRTATINNIKYGTSWAWLE